MKYLLGLILASALFVTPALAAPVWHPPSVLCERLETARENPKAMRWIQHLRFTTIDCSNGVGQQDPA